MTERRPRFTADEKHFLSSALHCEGVLSRNFRMEERLRIRLLGQQHSTRYEEED